MKLLITGGAGYIGSITNEVLQKAGHETVIYDRVACRKSKIGIQTESIVGDLRDLISIQQVFKTHTFDAVIHFAASALAGESMQKPHEYFENNILGGLNLLDAMRESPCKTFIFSSTCAVYGYPTKTPVTEDETIKPVSVYGASKRMFEEILAWYETLYGIKIGILRYFNASGAALDGSLGELHVPESHIIPIALDVALGKQKEFSLYGNDYETQDGTCVRDYIHVLDLADAHILAASHLLSGGTSFTVNLGVGTGYSNLEILSMIEKVTGKKIPYKILPRRAGDPAKIFADNTKARELLGWTPKYSDLETIISSAWKWHSLLKKDGS
jgi:UDP-glucose 4-epimerase